MADTTYLPKVYKKAGGNEQVIASGGKQTVESGGIVDFESGSYLKIAGVAVTATAEQLNGMTSTIEVKNSSGGDYTAGTLVYVSGWSGTTPTVTKADADAIASMATHVLTEAIANGATGTADGEATISNIDTSGAGDVGSPAYLSATAGGFAWTAPAGVGQVAQMVGLCKTKHATTGSMWFFPAYGYVIAQPASTLQGVTASADEINLIDGSTAGTVVASKAVVVGANKNLDTLAIADGGLKLGADAGTAVSSTAAELNLLDGSTAGTVVASKAVVVGANKNLDTLAIADGGLKLGADAGTAVSSTAAELNLLDGSTAGTVVASKAVVVGANKNLDTLAIADGGLKLGADAGTAVSSTAAELNLLDGSTVGTAVASKALVLGATKNVDTLLVDVAAPVATGANQSNSTALTADTNLVTGADNTTGVVLPTAVAGRRVIIKNTVANKVLPVWPATGAAINALGANAVCTLPAGCLALFFASSATQWYTTAVPDGITADAAELNLLDGSTAGTVVASKAVVVGADKNLDVLAVADLKLGAGAGTSVTSTAAELNILDGVTADKDEINLIDGSTAGTVVASKAVVVGANKNLDTLAIADGGLKLGADAGTAVSSTAAELNLLDGSTAGTVVASKAVVVGANKNLDTLAIADGGLKLGADAGTAVTSTAAELNILDGVTADKDEINLLDGATAGTAVASKAAILGANKNLDVLAVADGGFSLGAGAGTAVTATAAELNLLDTATAGTVVASKALIAGANKNLDTLAVADGGFALGVGAGTAVTSTAAELNLLDGSLAGTAVASKAAVLGANKNLDTLVVADSGLFLGAGAGTAVTSTAAEINKLAGAGVNVTAANLNTLTGGAGTALHTHALAAGATDVTATAAEVNKLAAVVAGATTASKALVVGANKELDILAVADLKLGAGAGTSVTATADEINVLDTATAGTTVASKALIAGANKNLDILAVADLKLGAGAGTSVTSTADELNNLAGVVAGVATASQAAVLGANKNLDVLAVADLKLGAAAGTSVTSTADELNLIDGSLAGTAVASKAAVLGANKNLDTLVIADGGLFLGAGAGTAVTATAAEINLLDTAVAGTAVASKAAVLGANKNLDTLVVADSGLFLGAGAGTAVTCTAAELNVLDGAPSGCAFTVGVEGGNVINVALQLTVAGGADPAVRTNVFAYLSDDANGDSLATAAPSAGVTVGVDGLAIPVVAAKAWRLTSETDGEIDLDIGEAGGATWYLIVVLPNGKLAASAAITFAA